MITRAFAPTLIHSLYRFSTRSLDFRKRCWFLLWNIYLSLYSLVFTENHHLTTRQLAMAKLLYFLVFITSLFVLYSTAAPVSFAEVEESWRRGLSEVLPSLSNLPTHSHFSFPLPPYLLPLPLTHSSNKSTPNPQTNTQHPPASTYTYTPNTNTKTNIPTPQHPITPTIIKKPRISRLKACWMRGRWL